MLWSERDLKLMHGPNELVLRYLDTAVIPAFELQVIDVEECSQTLVCNRASSSDELKDVEGPVMRVLYGLG